MHAVSRRAFLPAALREPEFLIAQVILWTFVALTSLQVVLRYLFNAPLSWPEELNAILLVWMTFIGAVGLARRNAHIRLEIVEEWLGPPASLYLQIAFHLLTLGLLVYLVVGGWAMFQELQFERTPALQLKLNFVFSIVPISAALMAVIYLGHIASALAAIRKFRHHAA